jgi:hypothetical protein
MFDYINCQIGIGLQMQREGERWWSRMSFFHSSIISPFACFLLCNLISCNTAPYGQFFCFHYTITKKKSIVPSFLCELTRWSRDRQLQISCRHHGYMSRFLWVHCITLFILSPLHSIWWWWVGWPQSQPGPIDASGPLIGCLQCMLAWQTWCKTASWARPGRNAWVGLRSPS